MTETSTRAPRLERIELRQLEQVVEICRTGGFSGAARHLGITQPALSKSIARLEEQLGVQLFDRDRGGAYPTQFGQLVADRGRFMLGSASALRGELSQLAGGGAGRLRIGVGPATRLKPLPEVALAILAQFPGLQLEIQQERGEPLVRGVVDGRYDLVFGYYETAEPFGDLMRIKIFEDRRVAVVRPGHPALDLGAPLNARQFLRYPSTSAGLTQSFRRWTGPMSPAEKTNALAMVCDDYDVIRQCVANTDYIAWGPRFAFDAALNAGAVVELPITWTATYACWMLTTETQWRSPLIKAIARMAKAPSPESPPAP